MMKKCLTCFLTVILAGSIISCSTDDVEGDIIIGDTELVEIPDAAFGEYMLYNEVPGITSEIEDNQVKYFLNPQEVLVVSELSLSKTSSNVQTLTNAGLTTAETKIADVTGIEYFLGLQRIVLTANDVLSLDVSALTGLEALEVNFNLVGSLDLSNNPALEKLRYRGSAQAGEDQKLSSIDLSNNPELRHLFLPNHNLVSVDLSNNPLIDDVLDLSGNPGPDGNPDTPDIVVPEAIFNQVPAANRAGVIPDIDEDVELVEIPNAAFGEYMLHNQTPGITSETEDGQVKFFLNPNEVIAVTELLLSKTSSNVSNLVEAGLETAEVKITDISGIEYFTSLQRLVLTANDVEFMDLSALTNLDALEMNFNLVGNLDLSNNTALTKLRYRGSAQANNSQKLSTIDLSNNTQLKHLFLPNHNIVTIDLSNNLMIDELLDLSGNPGPDGDPDTADIVIPAVIYNQLDPENRSGVVSD